MTTDGRRARNWAWLNKWMVDTARKGAMSQRKKNSVEAHGGLEAAIDAARDRGLHLVLPTDDTGAELVVASTHPFRVLA